MKIALSLRSFHAIFTPSPAGTAMQLKQMLERQEYEIIPI